MNRLPVGRSRLSVGGGRRLDNHPAYWAFVLHRLSGVVLALFLPAHFYVLALAIEGEGRLDAFLSWTDDPWVKLSEAALMVLLAVHMTGGLRLLAVEFLPWRDWQETLIACALGAALVAGAAFLAIAV